VNGQRHVGHLVSEHVVVGEERYSLITLRADDPMTPSPIPPLVAQVAELVEALNRTTDERHRSNKNLAMIARDTSKGQSSPKVPAQ
jgi:hypothetical protein